MENDSLYCRLGLYVGRVYAAKNRKNGKLYIGKTIQPAQVRLNKHFRDAFNKNNREYNTKFNRAIRKYGTDIWDLIIIEDNIKEQELNELEIFYIDKYDTYNSGYNSTLGGEGISGHKHSEETKEKIRKSSTGRKHTEESKKKMSRVQKGKFVSEETKRKIGAAAKGRVSPRFTGKKHTEEAKRKISKAGLGRKLSKDILEKRSFHRTGISCGGSSKYIGVSYQKRINRWRAKFKEKYLGVFIIEEEAALAYNKEAIKKYGDKAKLNIIDSRR